jgi:deazaflavin-dependent oxidoreductase (nitroreductase family)
MTSGPTSGTGSTITPEDALDSPFMPPRLFVRLAWLGHRALFRVTGGRRGIWPPKPSQWGTMRLVTVGRKSGKAREAIVAYFEDGPNIVTMAMNGWGEGEPAWWLNLLAGPDAEIELKGEARTRAVRARAAVGDERERLWDLWRGYTPHLDGYATRRTTETAVVVLEPRLD